MKTAEIANTERNRMTGLRHKIIDITVVDLLLAGAGNIGTERDILTN